MDIKLPKLIKNRKKRIGRGYGSGKGGHTVGRGQKGQKARRNLGILFEGVKVRKSLIKRLPLSRGKGKFKSRPKPLIVKTDYLNLLPTGSVADLDTLVKYKIVKRKDAEKFGIKILGKAKLEKKITVALPISKSAALVVEKAGGKVDLRVSKTVSKK